MFFNTGCQLELRGCPTGEEIFQSLAKLTIMYFYPYIDQLVQLFLQQPKGKPR